MAPQPPRRPRRLPATVFPLSLLLASTLGCERLPTPVPAGEPAPTTSLDEAARSGGSPLRPLAGETLGDPLPGLTPDELAAFERGRLIFNKRFTPEEGLGPDYNATSCASCHSKPVPGGSADLYRNFYVAMWGTAPNQAKFPDLQSPVVPAFGPHTPAGIAGDFSLEEGRFVLPSVFSGQPVVVGQRNSIPIFGTGLFEFVSNATILANADPFDADSDGVSGRVNIDFSAVGRFGLKAQSNNIERFTRPPLNNQMGITSDPFLGSAGTVSLASLAAQGTGEPDLPTKDNDAVPDPEISREDLGDLIAFSRFLAPPDRLPFDAEALAGQVLFGSIGCAKCHLPSLTSSLGPVEAYTDLLLHDMGPALADNFQFGSPPPPPTSTATEFRTQPLWGVSLFGPYLHDGRAPTLRAAVEAHGGEAQISRDAFLALSASDQQALLTFLEKL